MQIVKVDNAIRPVESETFCGRFRLKSIPENMDFTRGYTFTLHLMKPKIFCKPKYDNHLMFDISFNVHSNIFLHSRIELCFVPTQLRCLFIVNEDCEHQKTGLY